MNGTLEEQQEPVETYHVYPVKGGMVILKEEAETEGIHTIETTLATQQTVKKKEPHIWPAIAFGLFYLCAILSCIVFQVYCMFNPPTATINILTTQTPLTTHATLSLPAHPLPPLLFSQKQTINTTGHGHQAATQATGYVTFYNALTQPQTIYIGTLLVGTDGEQVVTDETAYIPAGNLATNGQTTVSAHAVNFGSEGNIHAGDIYGACCRALIQVANSQFSGGQNERYFQAVTKGDIEQVVRNLTNRFQQTMTKYLLNHVSSAETLIMPIPCTTTLQSDHAIGAEASLVTVTFQKKCSPLSYTTGDLQYQAENKLTQDAHNHLGNDYTLQGSIATSITKTTIQTQTILLSVTCSGSWTRTFNTHFLATLIAGKTPDQAINILARAQEVTQTGIHLEGLTDRIPKNPDRIHFVFLYETAYTSLTK